MTRSELAAELGGILRLLREHAFLRYSPSGQREYDDKLKVAESHYAGVVSRATGLPVPNPFPYSGIESLDALDADSVVRAARRTASRLSAASRKADAIESARLALAAGAWKRAAEIIAALPR